MFDRPWRDRGAEGMGGSEAHVNELWISGIGLRTKQRPEIGWERAFWEHVGGRRRRRHYDVAVLPAASLTASELGA